MAVITMSRELGSNGDRIADLLCEELGYCRVDKAMLTQIAQEAGVDTDAILEVEQSFRKRARLVSDEMTSLYRKQSSAFEKARPVDDVTYAQVVKETLEDFARAGDALIIGRGGQMVLRNWPNTLHVRLFASLDVRIKRLMDQENIPESEARRRIAISDEKRREYIRRMHNNADWRNLKYYDLAIDTSRLSPEVAVQMIIAAARAIDERQEQTEQQMLERFAFA